MIAEDVKKQIFEDLARHRYSVFQTIAWDAKCRTDLVEALNSHGYVHFQIHKLRYTDDQYAVVLADAKNSIEHLVLEREYSIQRGFLKKKMPLIVAGLLIALIVLYASKDQNLMSSTIVCLIPIVLGALFEYSVIKDQPQSLLKGVFKRSGIALLVILVFAIIVLREGTICLVILMPIIYLALLLGAVVMRFICFTLWKPTTKIYSLALLPLIFYFALPDLSQHNYGQTQREMVIYAPQEQVFKAINHIGSIQAEEVPDRFIFRMGFPKPIFGMTEQRAEGMVRTIQWERGVKFEERVQASHAPYLLSWDYQFNENSFPKGSLDDHVEVGGKYFDLLKTDYQLEKIDAKTTKLILTIDYRVSTEYNWYSKLWVNYILTEFSDVVMTIHKHRLEQ
ncbi:hypothetical protein [Acinetobacter tianfuensis]|uniref:Uncharacterized protein n=1 Tax=Acinetobacter tianfuensis TaxID=2419603 RepID=A0A3A8ELJ7_9GAMM|nr:hypothetical protein [Acinetobacter tianfuensis]RKG29243.1 hypothetical protein D7V32_15920 [Acinetobacter tianfuensis]